MFELFVCRVGGWECDASAEGRRQTDRHLGNVLSAAEQDGHDQRMGKPDLDAVHETVPCALEDGEVVMVSRVVEDGLQCSSGHINRCRAFQNKKKRGEAGDPWK